MQDYLTDARIENAIDEVTRHLSAGAYAQGASQMISIVRQYVGRASPRDSTGYMWSPTSGSRPGIRPLTKNEIILALVVASQCA